MTARLRRPLLPPANSVAPVASGVAQTGQTLSTTNGTWGGLPTITFTYQWRADGADIGGATSSSYVLTANEVGKTVLCRVTGTNAHARSTADSNGLGPVT